MGKTVAVIGASSDRHKFGNKAVRAFLSAGYTVLPINPHERSVEGLPAYASVLDVPGPIEMATVYVQPDVGERLLAEIQAKNIGEVWFNPGSESSTLMAEARRLGINAIYACSIIGIGQSPYRF